MAPPHRGGALGTRKRCMILPALLLIPGLLLFQLVLRDHVLVGGGHGGHGHGGHGGHSHSNSHGDALPLSADSQDTIAPAVGDDRASHGGGHAHAHAHAHDSGGGGGRGSTEGSVFGGVTTTTLLRSLGMERGVVTLPPPPPQKPSASPRPPRLGTLDDPDPIHIVYTLCGNPNEVEKDHYGLLGVKSLLMAKANNEGERRHYIFHILTNVVEEELFNTTYLNWEVYRAMVKEARAGLITFHVYHIDDLDKAVQATLGPTVNPNLMVPHHIFKNCAASRLKLPFLLGGVVERVIYLDWDSVCMCDLTRLWDEWDRFSPTATLGFANADPSQVSERDTYREWNMPRHMTLGSINSGVMLMHIGRLHAAGQKGTRAFWASAAGIIRSRANITGGPQDYWDLTKAFPLGDQDLLNMLFAPLTDTAPWGHPEWLHVIPPQYNYCIDPPWLEDLAEVEHIPIAGYPGPSRPCVIHFCGNRIMPNSKGAEYLHVTDSVQASFMYIKYWQLERRDKPPGMRER